MIYFVIPVFNRLAKTVNCLESLKLLTLPHKVVVVDDGSTDGTYQFLSERYPDVELLKGSGHLFWTGGVHKGIEYVLSKKVDAESYLVLMNNDSEVIDGSILERMIEFIESKQRKVICAALTVSISDISASISSGTIVRSWFFNRTKKISKNDTSIKSVKDCAVAADFLTARFLVHPIEVFEIVGNYNYLKLPHYGGDDGFSIRCKRSGFIPYVKTDCLVGLSDDEDGSISKGIIYKLFNKRSSINIIDKVKLAYNICPRYAILPYVCIGVIKSIFTALMVQFK